MPSGGASAHTSAGDNAASVALPGLARPLRILHISDSHIDKGTDLG